MIFRQEIKVSSKHEENQKIIARDTLPDVHIHNVAVGPDPEMDKANTVFMRCVDQVQKLVH